MTRPFDRLGASAGGAGRGVRAAALALALAAPAAAPAQEAAPRLQEDPRAAKFKDVERGPFIAFEAGYLHLFETPAASNPDIFPLARSPGGSAGGMLVSALVGTDIGSRLQVAVYGQGGNERASANYGAFSLYAAGLDVKLAFYGRRDRNDWERFYVYAHARGGYARTYPEGLFGNNDLVVAGGLGVEYYTQLRHFSVGLGADAVYATKAKAAGLALYPTVRYTF